MNPSTQYAEPLTLRVENVGGISETSVRLQPGVNVLSGRNATNRTSLLRSIMAGLGSNDVSMKGDADEGGVELQIGDEAYTRRFVRQNGSVRTSGDPYLEDPELADLFAFLLATNEARQAVLTGDDLRELIMRPVDTEAINDEIAALREESNRIERELEALPELRRQLTDLEGDRADIDDEIAATRAELEEAQERIEAADAGVDETREEKAEVDRLLSELSDARSELETVRQELEAQRGSLAALNDQREELEADAAELPDSPEGKIGEIDARIDDLRAHKQSVEAEVNTLQRIIQFNEDNLEGASPDILAALTDDHDASPTDDLLDDDSVVCWTCGHEVDREDIEATLEQLRELRKTKLGRSREIDDEIDELEEERIRYQEKQRQRDQVTEELRRTRERIADREEAIDDLETRRASLGDRIDELDARVEERRTQQNSEVLALHKEATQLEVELDRLEAERERVTEEIADVEAEIERLEDRRDRREAVADELAELRTRIDEIEADAVASFNEQMETVLDTLAYENLARIWIERRESEVTEGRRTVTRPEFTLHIVRESDAGTAYEDTIDHLSESEREVTGLVFALAGYLVHDVHETVPVMLLDSVEAIDAGRIAALVDHFANYPDYFVAALLPEDADAVEAPDRVVTDI